MASAKPLLLGMMIPSAEGLSPEAMSDLAVRAEAAGLSTVWHGDHIAMPVQIESKYPYGGAPPVADWPFPDVFSTLAFIAARTSRIRLGTSVLVVPIRHPLSLAKSAATVDLLSGGRLSLGVGAGWLREEFEALGYDHFGQRWKVLEEHVDAAQRLWRDDRSAHDGDFGSFPSVAISPTPAQNGGPPVLIGGKSKAARRLARKYGGWMPFRSEPEEVREGLEEIGRDDITVVAAIVVRVQAEVEPGESWRIIGPVGHVEERLRAYIDAGVTEFQMSDRISRLNEVLPCVPEIAALVNGTELEQGTLSGDKPGARVR